MENCDHKLHRIPKVLQGLLNLVLMQIKNFLLFIWSDKAPISNVVIVAEIELAPTISEISVAEAWKIL